MTVSPVFAKLLDSRRGYFNQRFLQARWESPALDPSVFLHLVGHVLDPLVVKLAEEDQPDKLPVVVEVLYDSLLTLYERNLLGDRRLIGSIQRVWEDLFPDLTRHLMKDAERVAAALCNAVYHLSFHVGADPERWLQKMKHLGQIIPDVDILLTAGQVLAWRCGMAHYRLSALNLAKKLGQEVFSTIFDLPSTVLPSDALSAMQADPWWHPEDKAGREMQVAAVVGDFAGFEGVFQSPPRVSANQYHFIAWDSRGTWALFADAFGHAFIPIDQEQAAASTSLNGMKVSDAGILTYQSQALHLPYFTALSSAAVLPHTLALTQSISHRIFLIHY